MADGWVTGGLWATIMTLALAFERDRKSAGGFEQKCQDSFIFSNCLMNFFNTHSNKLLNIY